MDRVTDGGVIGPLQDFVLRDPRTVRRVASARSTRGTRSTRSRSGGSPLLEFRQESAVLSTTGGTGSQDSTTSGTASASFCRSEEASRSCST